MAHFLCLLFLLLSSANACDRCVHQSKASHFSLDSPLPSGSCGYGSFALNLTGGRLAAAVPSLYKQGAGCGTCFQIRCKDPKLCSKTGTKVTVTDLNPNSQTDFVLSLRAFMALANPGLIRDVMKLAIVDVEYKRIPCEYKNHIAVRVDESSKNPHYLAITLLFQGGQTEIFSVNVAQVGTPNWVFLQRKQGAVWDTRTVPNGALEFRFAVTSGLGDRKWIWAKNVLPADWKPGQIYDSKVQFTAIAQEDCSPCDDGSW
ncbi:EXPANSIN L1, expansin-like A1 [Hibiscus trionum]|uniref:EXPANSIN L1, expansin-like A1 n=1 Tax=Hibiscus trionum TaxID=183268 RepID=A0A9W7MTN9_HIBTR|nr:EXPANSIN L1, expansin-like A1 [Hibiscus trionum]